MIARMTAAEQTLDGGSACLLITGAPGAGKSTISRLIADQLTRSALMDSYFVGRLVASGYVWPLGEPADEAARQVLLLNTNDVLSRAISPMPASHPSSTSLCQTVSSSTPTVGP